MSLPQEKGYKTEIPVNDNTTGQSSSILDSSLLNNGQSPSSSLQPDFKSSSSNQGLGSGGITSAEPEQPKDETTNSTNNNIAIHNDDIQNHTDKEEDKITKIHSHSHETRRNRTPVISLLSQYSEIYHPLNNRQRLKNNTKSPVSSTATKSPSSKSIIKVEKVQSNENIITPLNSSKKRKVMDSTSPASNATLPLKRKYVKKQKPTQTDLKSPSPSPSSPKNKFISWHGHFDLLHSIPTHVKQYILRQINVSIIQNTTRYNGEKITQYYHDLDISNDELQTIVRNDFKTVVIPKKALHNLNLQFKRKMSPEEYNETKISKFVIEFQNNYNYNGKGFDCNIDDDGNDNGSDDDVVDDDGDAKSEAIDDIIENSTDTSKSTERVRTRQSTIGVQNNIKDEEKDKPVGDETNMCENLNENQQQLEKQLLIVTDENRVETNTTTTNNNNNNNNMNNTIVTVGTIRVGENHQAKIPPMVYHNTKYASPRTSSPIKVWDPIEFHHEIKKNKKYYDDTHLISNDEILSKYYKQVFHILNDYVKQNGYKLSRRKEPDLDSIVCKNVCISYDGTLQQHQNQVGNYHHHLPQREYDIDAIHENFYQHSYDIPIAVKYVQNSPTKFIKLWTCEDIQSFNIGFRHYNSHLHYIFKRCFVSSSSSASGEISTSDELYKDDNDDDDSNFMTRSNSNASTNSIKHAAYNQSINMNDDRPKGHKDIVDYYYRYHTPNQFQLYEDRKRDEVRKMLENLEHRRLLDIMCNREKGNLSNGFMNNRVRVQNWPSSFNSSALEERHDKSRRFLSSLKDQISMTNFTAFMDCLERFYEDTTVSQSYNDNIANSNEDTKHTTQESNYNKEHVKCNEKEMELDKMKKRCFDLLGNDETLIQSFLQFLPKPKINRVS